MATSPRTRLRDLLADGTDRAVFGLLTDEELLSLDHDVPDELRVTPFLDDHPSLDPGLARALGSRNLLVRGLVDPVPSEHGVTVRLGDELETVLRCRREGVGLLRAHADVRPYRAARSFVVHDELGGFEEDVQEMGLHYLAACTWRSGCERLAEWCLPEVPEGGRRRTRVGRRDWARFVVDELGPDARVRVLDVLLPDAPGGRARPVQWWVGRGASLSVLARPTDDDDALAVEEVGERGLADHLVARVHEAVGRVAAS